MRQRLEYALAWPFIKALSLLPRPLSRAAAISLAWLVYLLHVRLRRVGMRNLAMALPEKSHHEHAGILRREFTSLGRQLAEVCQFPRYTRDNVSRVVVYDGFENYERVFTRGKGVLFLTAHFGGWELSAFVHSLHGHWMHVLVRNLDNVYLDRLSQRYRSMHGNATVSKDNFVRGLLAAMKAGEVVGILMDTNMTPPQGVFVDFFGISACTASGLARIAAVVPSFTVWDPRCGNTACGSIPLSNLCAPETTRKTSFPIPSCSRKLSKTMCAAILTSGCGSIAAGRRGRQENRGCTDKEGFSYQPISFSARS